mgnify:CR=1 FL=1
MDLLTSLKISASGLAANRKRMGAISSNGVVGIVIGVSNHYSVIMSMLHHNMRISARVKANNQLVNVVWSQSDYQIGTITDIPSHLQLEKGDSIVTSGNSLIFPKNILIGTVDNHVKEIGEHLGSAVIRFSTDFNSLKHVYLIENFMVYEQDSLLMQIHLVDKTLALLIIKRFLNQLVPF